MHPLEVQVLGETLDARVADVDAIEEAEHVEDCHDGDTVPVDLAPDGALFVVGPGELGEGCVGGVGVFVGLLMVEGWVGLLESEVKDGME